MRGVRAADRPDVWDDRYCPLCGARLGGGNLLVGEETFCGVAFVTKTCLSCGKLICAEKKFKPKSPAQRQWSW